jgi:hypothetical protein
MLGGINKGQWYVSKNYKHFANGCKHGKLYILFTLSRLNENKHKIAIKPMKKLVYIEFFSLKYTEKHSYCCCALIFNFQIVSISFLFICLKCK